MAGRRRLGTFRALAGNSALRRVVGGYALFRLTEYSVWIAMLVYAYGRGGATIAGLVALAQLVPAALLAPVFATLGDRRSPVVLLAGGYLAQAAAMAATAVAITGGMPAMAYAAAVVASAAFTATRPAQSTLIPSLAGTPDQLTAANVVLSWVEAAAIAAAGSLTGVLIWFGGAAGVFGVCAALGAVAALLVARLRVPALAAPQDAPAVAAGLSASARLVVRQPRLRLMLALLTAEAAVVGALDLLFVILAVTVLGRPQAWAGYLNSAYGVGAILAATLGVLLVGRRLGGPIAGSALLLSGALAALAASLGLAGTVALLTAAGASRALLDVASRALLQRSVPAQSLGQVFGLLEGLTRTGLAIGSVLVPVLVHLGGSRLALLGVAAVLPLAAAAGGRALVTLDAQAPVPVVQIALLRSLPLFADLPAPAVEGLAAALTPAEVPAGAVLIRQGEQGDAYYAIAAGQFDVLQDGRLLRRCGRGEGVGEIALLRAVPRTASVIAHTPATVYRLARDPFLTAVLGHAATRRHAHSIADAQLAADAARGNDPGPADATDPG
ncbi:MAG TPA: cyclic nucleotide-binding domain-containing protein [Streptosporangiaceae bacterium]|nr:cyclic nucleotide-binding domain-containing protein [Streptosporangiaceae bacterium]HEX3313157.1 cyclic nucleotide-binding domain-containing protein [Streptosporangiaceae bacterium]